MSPGGRREGGGHQGRLEPGACPAAPSLFLTSAAVCVLAWFSRASFLHNAGHKAAGSPHASWCPVSSPPDGTLSSCLSLTLENLGGRFAVEFALYVYQDSSSLASGPGCRDRPSSSLAGGLAERGRQHVLESHCSMRFHGEIEVTFPEEGLRVLFAE